MVEWLRYHKQNIAVRSGRHWRDFWINYVAAGVVTPSCIRRGIYRMYGMEIETKEISPRCQFAGNRFHIGQGSYLNYGCYMECTADVRIGENVRVAMNVSCITSTHEIGDETRRGGKGVQLPITIEDGCWIGAHAVILPGVTIHKGTVIAAGAVVTQDCEANAMYGGVPAHKIKDLS